MNSYRVETIGDIYGKSIKCVSANTPYDAAEKGMNHMPWRHKEDVKIQTVMILDGTKQTWTFQNNNCN